MKMKVQELRVRMKQPFCELFPVSPKILDAVTEAMSAWGYDQTQPIILWREGDVILDGYTRLAAAEKAGIDEVPVCHKSFADETEALAYAIHLQKNRRNLTDAEILRCIEALDRKRERGGDRRSAKVKKESIPQSCGIDLRTSKSPSAEETARTVGVSPRKVEQARTVIEQADDDVKEAVRTGEMSINRAYETVVEKRKATQQNGSVFNETNDKVEWARWTWNPVTGCRHGCSYCYARDIARRFYPPKIGFSPHFYPERLSAPQNTPVPKSSDIRDRLVFCVSMGDLFGDWVPKEWIEQVLDAIRKAPQWTFIVLTKNPAKCLSFDLPPNLWMGATTDIQARVIRAFGAFEILDKRPDRPSVLFLSAEPLREKIDLPPEKLRVCDWLIIGGQSRTSSEPERQPEWEWVEHILWQAREAGCKVFFKPNLTVQPREYPNMEATKNGDR